MNASDAGRAEIGVIGGSGLYALDAITGAERIDVEPPYGPPSAPIVLGTLHAAGSPSSHATAAAATLSAAHW